MKDIITMYFAMPFLENFDTNLALIFYRSYKCYCFFLAENLLNSSRSNILRNVMRSSLDLEFC